MATSENGLPYWEEWNGAILGGISAGIYNMMARKPIASRLPLYAVLIPGGYLAGKYLHNIRVTKDIERDIYIMDYVKTHPEDFPEQAPKTYKDVFQKWHPIR